MATKPDTAPDTKPDTEPDTNDTGTGAPPSGKDSTRELEEMRAALRKANREAETNRTRLKELEDRDKSDADKLAERVTAAEQRAAEAEARALRLEIAAAKGLTPAQAKRLVGTTAEELEADAAELLSTFKPANSGDPDPAGSRPPSGKPTERLQGGGNPSEEPVETDPAKLAALVPRGI